MAAPLPCDICTAEQAVQMLTNLLDGNTIAIGAGCLPVFYGQSLALALSAGDHEKIPSKCQACRRVHEYFAVIMSPPADTEPSDPAQTTPDAEVTA
jgi:hypothetical protein